MLTRVCVEMISGDSWRITHGPFQIHDGISESTSEDLEKVAHALSHPAGWVEFASQSRFESEADPKEAWQGAVEPEPWRPSIVKLFGRGVCAIQRMYEEEPA